MKLSSMVAGPERRYLHFLFMVEVDMPLRKLQLLFAMWCFCRPAVAELQITEVLYDSGSSEPAWEWIEIHNASSSSIDLYGFVLDDLHETANAISTSNVGVANQDNIVEPGTFSVLFNGRALGFDGVRFRDAWSLPDSVHLIAVDGFPSLNNSGDSIGLWSSYDDYHQDLANSDADSQLEVTSTNHAIAQLDFGLESFPRAAAGSIVWAGQDDYQKGESWEASKLETPGTWLSSRTLAPSAPVNSDLDQGSPGVENTVGSSGKLSITELMYDPKSALPSEWEWIEIVNDSSQPIDFEISPHFLDDAAGAALKSPNLNSGRIGIGENAVLFRDSVPLDHMQRAWGGSINMIPVSSWPTLNSDGDTIAVWSNNDSYYADKLKDDRTFQNSTERVDYRRAGGEWPEITEGQSIRRLDLEVDPSDGANWRVSEVEDGSTRRANIVIADQITDHEGGDLGSPGRSTWKLPPKVLDIDNDGVVNQDDATLLCSVIDDADLSVAQAAHQWNFLSGDFDLGGNVDFADFLILSGNFGQQRADYAQGDANCDGTVTFADFLILSHNFGRESAASVPEPEGAFGQIAMLVIFVVYRELAFRPHRGRWSPFRN